MIDLIGPPQVKEELGRGGTSVVYRASDTRPDREVAIKALPPELASDPDGMGAAGLEQPPLAMPVKPISETGGAESGVVQPDSDLETVIQTWPDPPESIRRAIVAMVSTE